MTKEEIIEMADKTFDESSFTDVEILRFAKLVAEKEREACAKLCDEHPGYLTGIVGLKIRARGQE